MSPARLPQAGLKFLGLEQAGNRGGEALGIILHQQMLPALDS